MNNSGIFNLNRTAILAGIISASFSLHAMASAGKVEFALGGANLLRNDGSSRQISKGDEINPGDTIKTTDGRVQVRFSDGGYMSFQPNTEFKVEDYSYSGKTDGTEKAFFRLIAGGLRAITGVVGHANKPNYKVSTPVATIGIRGSEYFANYNGKLTAHCNHGSIYVANDQGNLILFRGQTAVVANGAPSYGDNTEGVGARGPTNTNTAYQQQNNDSNTNNLFRTGDLRNEDGTLKALGDVGDIGVAYTNYYSGAEGGSYSNYSVLDGTYLETDKTSLVKDPSGNLASITNTYTQSYDGSESLKTVRTDTNFSGDQIKGSNGGISWVRVDGSVTITNTYYWSGSSTPDYSYSGTVNNPQYIFGNLTPLQDMNNLVLAQYVATYNYAGGT
ncbi:MAG: FecR domain-containing protein, partial [Methylophilaceae bacterium]|nr:FecR family protein [Methyloradius sp.]